MFEYRCDLTLVFGEQALALPHLTLALARALENKALVSVFSVQMPSSETCSFRTGVTSHLTFALARTLEKKVKSCWLKPSVWALQPCTSVRMIRLTMLRFMEPAVKRPQYRSSRAAETAQKHNTNRSFCNT